ncbi:hypothetical protein J4E85_011544 [Alternaria conjuncta]|uniref:uncharacterized protein n=1 Tax=Alternaria conjuncta TaxID=181017 RepID=UPI00221F260E|nr:uncharacterized protein J4E85_011544 [Alternaria conjuncta]KAI4909722.1 hypothetical protein J4E85_011544 [Alternaria conjuncta]
MTAPATFTRFPDLSAELQVMIINYTLEEDMAQREDELSLHLHAPSSCKTNNINIDSQSATPRTTIRLPKLPSVYHTSRLFRSEALRTQPLHQVFTSNAVATLHSRSSMFVYNPAHDAAVNSIQECRLRSRLSDLTTFDASGSMAIYNPVHDTVVLQVHECCLNSLTADLWQLFHVIKAALWAPERWFVVAIVERTRVLGEGSPGRSVQQRLLHGGTFGFSSETL